MNLIVILIRRLTKKCNYDCSKCKCWSCNKYQCLKYSKNKLKEVEK